MQPEGAGTIPVSHHAVVCSHHAGKKAEADDALAIFVLHAFVVDQGNIFCDDGLQQLLIIGLFFAGVRKEQIGFVGDQV